MCHISFFLILISSLILPTFSLSFSLFWLSLPNHPPLFPNALFPIVAFYFLSRLWTFSSLSPSLSLSICCLCFFSCKFLVGIIALILHPPCFAPLWEAQIAVNCRVAHNEMAPSEHKLTHTTKYYRKTHYTYIKSTFVVLFSSSSRLFRQARNKRCNEKKKEERIVRLRICQIYLRPPPSFLSLTVLWVLSLFFFAFKQFFFVCFYRVSNSRSFILNGHICVGAWSHCVSVCLCQWSPDIFSPSSPSLRSL